VKQFPLSLAVKLLPLLLNTQGKKRLSILIYHRVLPTPDPMRPDEPTADDFDWQMRLLRSNFNPLPLVDGVEQMLAGSLPERAVCVTFDDGYADNAQCAMPILKKYDIPATVFVSTAFINGGRMWNDSLLEALRICDGDSLDLRDLDLDCFPLDTFAQRLAAAQSIIHSIKHFAPDVRAGLVEKIESRVGELPNDLMLTDAQIQSLVRNRIAIGAHTVNHPILASVADEVAHAEIRNSKMYLEVLTQMDVDAFAYPNGRPALDYGNQHRNMVEEFGFRAAVSTHWGVATDQSDRFQLPRFSPWDRQQLRFALRLLANYRRIDPLVADGFRVRGDL
jgi:peptidoglycan/xylan/chitin deacetylase (PgdA/CDA1 family)